MVAALPRASEQRVPDQRSQDQRQPRGFEPRLADIRAVASPQRFAPPTPLAQSGGSLLGMAHNMGSQPAPLPLPRPMPMNAAQWSYPNGG
jgi:hypothetical protein